MRTARDTGANDVAGEPRAATVALEDLIVAAPPRVDDPTETFHEASRLYPGVVDPLVPGGAMLESNAELRDSIARSVKRHRAAPVVELPTSSLGDSRLDDALIERRSRRAFDADSLTLEELATMLRAAYGVTGSLGGTSHTLRTAPSGGALFPLELYVAVARVNGLREALYHYDPLRDVLEELRPLDFETDVRGITPYPDVVCPSAALVIVTAMFWRSRFKYGARAYRFALIEAGHVAQNFLLAATALGLSAVPLGGFYDRRVDVLVGADGLYEATLYLLPVGRRE